VLRMRAAAVLAEGRTVLIPRDEAAPRVMPVPPPVSSQRQSGRVTPLRGRRAPL